MSTNFFLLPVGYSKMKCASHTILSNSFIHWFLPLVHACETIAWFMLHFSISHDYDLCKYVFIAVAYIFHTWHSVLLLYFHSCWCTPSLAAQNRWKTHDSDRKWFTQVQNTQPAKGQMNAQFNLREILKCNSVCTQFQCIWMTLNSISILQLAFWSILKQIIHGIAYIHHPNTRSIFASRNALFY